MEVRAEKGDKGFWDVHDKFFSNQKDLVNGQAPNVDAIVKMAAETGASADKLKKAIADQTHKKEIDADQELSEDFQASGTPHFFVNGRRLVGAQPQEKFEKIIDEEITKAQDLIAAGTKPTEVYAALIKDGKGPPEPEKKDVPKSLPAQRPRARQPEREGHDPRVERLPVPVLRARRADGRPGDEGLRRQGEVRVARPSAADAPGRAARVPGRA